MLAQCLLYMMRRRHKYKDILYIVLYLYTRKERRNKCVTVVHFSSHICSTHYDSTDEWLNYNFQYSMFIFVGEQNYIRTRGCIHSNTCQPAVFGDCCVRVCVCESICIVLNSNTIRINLMYILVAMRVIQIILLVC